MPRTEEGVMTKGDKTLKDRLYEARQAVERAAVAYIHEPYPREEATKLLHMLNTLDEMQKHRRLEPTS